MGDLARYKLSLEQTPVRATQQLPTGKTVNAHLSTVCEFLRFCAAQGHITQEVAERLVEPRLLHHAPRGYQRGEHGEHSTIRARILKAPEIEEAPATLTAEQSQHIVAAARTARDRLLLCVLLASGMRIGEALGLRREDMHLIPNATHDGRGPGRGGGLCGRVRGRG
uniref:Tyrosine-type recombinase/integrase n=1 Tax=Streptomyces sp. NBC_00049 TaxID=2903617 RepID=A0AAU2JKT5_9ACTN